MRHVCARSDGARALLSRYEIAVALDLLLHCLARGVAESGLCRKQRLEVKLIQTDGPDVSYNCHGWVFTGGKGWVRGSNVARIIRDNGYQEVTSPAPGDIAVYRDHAGEVTHTAVVRGQMQDGTLLLESKWGKLGRYIHTEKGQPYAVHACTFYSTERGGHVLQPAAE